MGMTDEELKAKIEELRAEQEAIKWVKVNELIPKVGELTNEELEELIARASAIKAEREQTGTTVVFDPKAILDDLWSMSLEELEVLDQARFSRLQKQEIQSHVWIRKLMELIRHTNK